MTSEKATHLLKALLEKLTQRSGAMATESTIAVGLSQPPPGFVCPPSWVLAAARIASKRWADVFRAGDGPGPVQADQVGALVGIAKTWSGFLAVPSPELQQLETKSPVLSALRARVVEISQPQVALGEKLGESVAKAQLNSRESLDFAKGQYAGASEVVDSSGELREETEVRTVVCFFIWLYWQELRFFNSVTDLEKFFDEFLPGDVTRKNLEKICREIGLRFKSRGRPRNPTAKKTP